MSQNKNSRSLPAGDYVTADEAVMGPETDLRNKCEVVFDVVSNNVFPLSKALKAYGVTFEQFVGYLLMSSKKVKIILDGTTVTAIAGALLGLMDLRKAKLDNRSQKLVQDMQQLVTIK